MSLLPWQAKLRVFNACLKPDTSQDSLGVTWYTGNIKIAIIPLVFTTIDNFYAEVKINGIPQRFELSMASQDQYGSPISIYIGEGYNLDPEKPIGKHTFTFRLMIRTGEKIEPKVCVILEAGIRKGSRWFIGAYRKSVLLKEEE